MPPQRHHNLRQYKEKDSSTKTTEQSRNSAFYIDKLINKRIIGRDIQYLVRVKNMQWEALPERWISKKSLMPDFKHKIDDFNKRKIKHRAPYDSIAWDSDMTDEDIFTRHENKKKIAPWLVSSDIPKHQPKSIQDGQSDPSGDRDDVLYKLLMEKKCKKKCNEESSSCSSTVASFESSPSFCNKLRNKEPAA